LTDGNYISEIGTSNDVQSERRLAPRGQQRKFIDGSAGWLVGGKGDRWELPSVALSKVHPLLVNRDLRPSVKDETMTRYCTDATPEISISIDRERARAKDEMCCINRGSLHKMMLSL